MIVQVKRQAIVPAPSIVGVVHRLLQEVLQQRNRLIITFEKLTCFDTVIHHTTIDRPSRETSQEISKFKIIAEILNEKM